MPVESHYLHYTMPNSAPLLVTGAAGFVAARFVESAQERGVPVISVDDRTYFDERPEHADIDFGTIVDRRELFDWLASERPALAGIVHLGARTDTTETDEAVLAELNVRYSQALWRYAAGAGVPFVYASSAATYGDGAWGYDDDESRLARLVPLNPYGRSKQAFDVWALAQSDTPIAWSGWKFFNVYGFGERHKGRMASVVLHAYDQLQAGGPIRLFRSHRPEIADGHQARDFIDVRDVIDVLWFALHRPVARGIYNLGTGQARTYLDLARAVCQSLGVEERIEFVDTPAAIRDKYQYFTEARMSRLRALGYSTPFTALESGVADYVSTLDSSRAARPA
jgi:ADP-L-glycero-D-manno-heptose 6-epimerase